MDTMLVTCMSCGVPLTWGCICHSGLGVSSIDQPAQIETGQLHGMSDENGQHQDMSDENGQLQDTSDENKQLEGTSDEAQDISQDDNVKLHIDGLNPSDEILYLPFTRENIVNQDAITPIYFEVIENNQDVTQRQNQIFNDTNSFQRETPPQSPEEIFRMNRLPENVPRIPNPPIRRHQASVDKRKIGEIGWKIHPPF